MRTRAKITSHQWEDLLIAALLLLVPIIIFAI